MFGRGSGGDADCNIVIIEGEDLQLVGDWKIKTGDSDASGRAYIVWEGLDPEENNRSPDDIITTSIQITVAGTYRFKWRMRQPDGVESDKANDTWLSFPNATRFGPLDDDAESWGSRFIKVYGNANDGHFEYSGRSEATHGVYSEVGVDFAEPGTYEMKIAGRSHGHEIDQIILYARSLDVADAANGCEQNGVDVK